MGLRIFNIMSEKSDLVILIEKSVARDPSLLPEILGAAFVGLHEFQQREKDKRDGLAYNAILSLMANSTLHKKIEPIYLFDVVYHHFPKGNRNASPVEEKFWAKFVELVKKYPNQITEEWIYNFKGEDRLKWWQTYIVPCLVN